MEKQTLIGVHKHGNVQEEFYMEFSDKIMSFDSLNTDTVIVTKITKFIPEPPPKRIIFSEHFYNNPPVKDISYKIINGMKVEYAPSMGIDINKITLKKEQLKSALKILDDNCTQVARVKLVIDKKTIYVCHEKCSGYKKPTKKDLSYDDCTAFACSYSRGIKRVQYFKSLEQQILKLLKK